VDVPHTSGYARCAPPLMWGLQRFAVVDRRRWGVGGVRRVGVVVVQSETAYLCKPHSSSSAVGECENEVCLSYERLSMLRNLSLYRETVSVGGCTPHQRLRAGRSAADVGLAEVSGLRPPRWCVGGLRPPRWCVGGLRPQRCVGGWSTTAGGFVT
jgi:hypothetical protein